MLRSPTFRPLIDLAAGGFFFFVATPSHSYPFMRYSKVDGTTQATVKNNLVRFTSITFLIALLVLFLFAYFPTILIAQNNEIKWEHLSIEHGLSEATVSSIIQDRQGFMWFGTQDGLNRYDGYTFTIFKHNDLDSNSISDNEVHCIYEDEQGNIWVGTFYGGLNRYEPEEDRFIHYKDDPGNLHGIRGTQVNSIIQGSTGDLWIGTWGGGLNRYEPTKNDFIHYQHDENNPQSLSDDRVRCVFEDTTEILWVGTWNGLNKLLPNRADQNQSSDDKRGQSANGFVRYFHDPLDPHSISSDQINSICEDKHGTLWVGTWGGGLNRYDRNKNQFVSYRHDSRNPNSLSSDVVHAVFVDSSGDIWIGTSDGGLNRYDATRDAFIHYRNVPFEPNSLSSDDVFSIYENRNGELWIGTHDGGVSRFDPKKHKFVHYTKEPNNPHSLGNNRVRSFCEDKHGDLWIGTADGLDRFKRNDNTFIHYVHEEKNPYSLSQNSVQCVCEDRDGVIWIGAWGGLNRYDRKHEGFFHYQHDPNNPRSLSHDMIRSLYVDRKGKLWIGTEGGGLDQYDRDKNIFAHYKHDDSDSTSLSGNWVFSIYEDTRGELWIGTWGRGLNRFNQEANVFTHYRHDPNNPLSLSNNTVFTIYEDRDGDLWLGTWGGGLNHYIRNSETFEHYSETDGLPDNVVYGILPDGAGNLWLSTNNGLAKFDPRTKTFRKFDVHDGLQSNEFNQGAYYKSRTGELFFGGINGFNSSYPDSIKENPHIPPIVITDFKVFEKSYQLNNSKTKIKEITLRYKENFFSFEFAALDYTAPQNNQYAYMLEGFDKDWIYCGTRRYAAYTNLGGGEYIFKVKGSNNDGVWNEQGVSVRITIIPPFWKTWWFTFISVVTVIAIAFLLYRLRVNQLLKIERTRNRIARDLHDEVSSTLSGIAYFAEAIRGQHENNFTPDAQKFLSLIHESVSTVQESMSDIIWSINPENDRWDHLLAKFRRYASDLFDSKSIRYHIDLPETLSVKRLDMDQRRNLWLIFKEMVTNAAKHSECSEATIRIDVLDGSILHFTVRDNGNGFDPMKSTDRNGIKNIQSRAEHLHASVKLDSSPGKGTRWDLTFQVH